MKTKYIVLLLSAVSACTATLLTAKKKAESINIAFLKGPTGMGGAYLWNKSDAGETRDNYNITLESNSVRTAEKLVCGRYDIACIPANIAYSMYKASQGKIRIAAVTTLGMLRIVSKNHGISGISDLDETRILSAGKGTVAEYALRFLLKKNNINAQIEFTSEHSETVRKALEGEYDTLLLPEPFASQLINENTQFSVSVDINDEWKRTGGTVLTMGCIAVNTDFYIRNKSAVRRFVELYRESADFINENTGNGAVFVDMHNIIDASVAKKAIPECNIVCFTGRDMETAMSLCESVLSSCDNIEMPEDLFIRTVSN